MKQIIQKIMFFVIIISSVTAYSQKCETIEDPITGEKKCSYCTKNRAVWYEYKYGDKVDFTINFIYSGDHEAKIAAGAEVFLKFTDNTILKLRTSEEALPRTQIAANAYGATVYTVYPYHFELNYDEIQALSQSRLILIRYPGIDGCDAIDAKFEGMSKGIAKKIQKGAICMRNNFKK